MSKLQTSNKYIAVDQYGNIHWIKRFPRKELLDYFGRKHADKVYCDNKQGDTFHVGYIVAGHWFNVYEIKPAYPESIT